MSQTGLSRRADSENARANGYSVAREYVDEAKSGRAAARPQFREMIEEGSKPKAPFEVILVWKFSRLTKKREHAVAFKAQLRRKGIRVVSITEQAEDNATGRLLEGIIESVDKYYSENLAQEVVRGHEEGRVTGLLPRLERRKRSSCLDDAQRACCRRAGDLDRT